MMKLKSLAFPPTAARGMLVARRLTVLLAVVALFGTSGCGLLSSFGPEYPKDDIDRFHTNAMEIKGSITTAREQIAALQQEAQSDPGAFMANGAKRLATIGESLGSLPDKAINMVSSGQAMLTKAPSQYAGPQALHLPRKLELLKGAVGALGEVPDEVVALVECVVALTSGGSCDASALEAPAESAVADGGGGRSAGLFKQLLALVVREKLRDEKMGSWLARAEANPEDRVAAFFAGVLLHYEREFERSNALLDRAAIELKDEPRLHIYRAMNAFNLGDRALAEASITKAASLETQDPDIFYCQGEIYRDTDRVRAREALAIYWFQTELNSDPNSSKQARVRGMMSAIDRCIADDTPAPCPGPWEHVFASARDTNRGSSDL